MLQQLKCTLHTVRVQVFGVPYESDHQECNAVLFGEWVPAQWLHFLWLFDPEDEDTMIF
jgi:hypothetical protein